MDSSQDTTTTNFTIGDTYEVKFENGRLVFVRKDNESKLRVIKVDKHEVTLEQVNKWRVCRKAP